MRRMYSEQELSKIIKEVFDAEVADGEFDETIADYVDAYLVEHPVDITALEGQDVELNSLDATGLITGGEIVEKMSGYAFAQSWTGLVLTYVGVVKNGNKVTFVIAGQFDGETGVEAYGTKTIGSFAIPSSVGSKLYPDSDTRLAYIKTITFTSIYNNAEIVVYIGKNNDTNISFYFATKDAIASDYAGKFRIEATFLLSDNLVGE